MKNYKSLKDKLLKDKEVKKAYEKLGPEFALIEIMIQERLEKGLTQKQVADKTGTQQSAIARFESGNYNPTLSFLQKIAEALGTQLQISLVKT